MRQIIYIRRTSSLPLFVPLPSLRPSPPPREELLSFIIPPPWAFPFEDDPEVDAAALACAISAFCSCTFVSLNLSSRVIGTHSSHLANGEQ
jgi:hypothetical protein